MRFYSLSGIGRADSPWEITLKRQGKVSTYLYDKAAVGTILYATMPQGLFILPQQLAVTQSYMFVAAGTGVTPMLGMLRAIARLPAGQRPQVQLHYGSRTPADIIARQELEKMDPTARWLRQWHYLSSKGQRLTTETVLANAGNLAMRSHWYICGPVTLKDQLVVALARQHVPQTQVHVEVFDQQKPRVPASLASHRHRHAPGAGDGRVTGCARTGNHARGAGTPWLPARLQLPRWHLWHLQITGPGGERHPDGAGESYTCGSRGQRLRLELHRSPPGDGHPASVVIRHARESVEQQGVSLGSFRRHWRVSRRLRRSAAFF